jgi:RNA polymerase sigma-70 factor (ECF subfamily)
MSLDVRMTATAAPGDPAANTTAAQATTPAGRRVASVPLSEDSQLAVEIRAFVEHGDLDTARQRFEGLVAAHQRRALRIAFQYLRDAAEADEAVQDAFVKVFSHIGSYREAWPFEVWFTRILINGCLDRRKARVRRDRWLVPADETGGHASAHDRAALASSTMGTGASDPEARLLARERRARMTAAIDRLEGRQRTVFMLCHYGDCTPREVGAMIGLNESTVRVHLFRAARKLRALLGGQP